MSIMIIIWKLNAVAPVTTREMYENILYKRKKTSIPVHLVMPETLLSHFITGIGPDKFNGTG